MVDPCAKLNDAMRRWNKFKLAAGARDTSAMNLFKVCGRQVLARQVKLAQPKRHWKLHCLKALLRRKSECERFGQTQRFYGAANAPLPWIRACRLGWSSLLHAEISDSGSTQDCTTGHQQAFSADEYPADNSRRQSRAR